MAKHDRPNTASIPIAEITRDFYVRKSLNHERVEFFIRLYKAKGDVDPIEISEDATYTLIDGRHRLEAMIILGWTHAECVLTKFDSVVGMIMSAFKANVGGPLPPSSADIEHTIEMLLDNGMNRKSITEQMTSKTGFPPRAIRYHFDNVKSAINKRRVRQAMTAIADEGLNVTQAAEKFGLEASALKDAISGNRRRKSKVGVAELKAGLSSRYKSHSLKTASLIRSLLEQFEDGETSGKAVIDIFDHLNHLLKRQASYLADWRQRFEKIAKGTK